MDKTIAKPMHILGLHVSAKNYHAWFNKDSSTTPHSLVKSMAVLVEKHDGGGQYPQSAE